MKAIMSLLLLFTFFLYYLVESQVVPDPMHEGAYFYPRPVHLPPTIHFKPTSDITRDTNTDSVQPIRFNFITDTPHSGLPGNNYIKPGDFVATMMIHSKPFFYNVQKPQEHILHKNNILIKETSKRSQGEKLV